MVKIRKGYLRLGRNVKFIKSLIEDVQDMRRNDQIKLNQSHSINNLPDVKKSLSIEILNIGKSVDNLTSQGEGINRFLDFNLVVSECRKHKIFTVALDYESCHRNYLSGIDEEKWGLLIVDSHRIDGYKYGVCLNPSLDKLDIACELTCILDTEVLPGEIYYPIFFHEIGHIVHEHKNIELLYFFNQCSQDEFEEIYLKQEEKAWKYARNRFIGWKNRSVGIPELQLPLYEVQTKFRWLLDNPKMIREQ